MLAIPAAAASMLPVLGCPLCWPGYAALLSSLGLGFLASSTYLLPLTAALLALAVVGLGWQIKSKGYGPIVMGLLPAAIILSDKFLLESYSSAAILVIAFARSLAPGRTARSEACPSCPPADQGDRQSILKVYRIWKCRDSIS